MTLTCILLCVLGAGELRAQQYNFRNYSVADGLAQSQVYAMCEDRRGNLWFGTRGGGLSRFDGRNFQTFSTQDGLIDNFVRSILEDRDGNLWIGTDEGLSCYDGRRFRNFTVKEGLPDDMVNRIMQDKKGEIWIGTDAGGVAVWDGRKFRVHNTKNGLLQNRITALLQDKNGDIWVGTEMGVNRRHNDTWGYYTYKDGVASNLIRDIVQAADGRIWFATFGGGISVFDGRGFTTYRQQNGLANNTVDCILQDKKGRLWFGTGGGGVSRWDGQRFTTFTETEGLCGNAIIDIIQDREGNIWLGSSGGGVSRFDSERFIHFRERNKELGNLSFAICQDSRGSMWFGSSLGGVTRYDGTYYTLLNERDGFTNHKVHCIYEAANGNMWFGTVGDGAYVYDGRRFVHYTSHDGLSGNFINMITADSAGNLWFATSGGGACMLPEGARRAGFRAFRHFKARNGLRSDRVPALLYDRHGRMWMGTQEGISVLQSADGYTEVTNYTTANGLGVNNIRCLAMDARGRIWAGSAGGGVSCFDGNRFITFNHSQGLSSDNIYAMVFDQAGNLWTGTEKGLDRLRFDNQLKLKQLRHFGRPEGFTGIEVLQNAVCRDRDGNLWFGTVDGASRYNPHEDAPDSFNPMTHITGLRLFYDPVQRTAYRDTTARWYPLPHQLLLPYDKNQLSFDFIGIHPRNPEGVRYSWKLEGFDEEWSPANTDMTATYSNLPPGSYAFYVKSANEDGVWDAVPQQYSFRISPPFWATWWFRSIAILAAAAVLYTAYYLRVRQLKRKAAAERNKIAIEKNVLELEQQALQLQMNPHFIFNALNSIQAFISRNDTAEAKRYLAKFAKLMRLTLESVRESFIPLEQEISLLKNYLDLEKLCRNNRFGYTFEIAEDIDAEAVLIPPMLLQPFLENAILHGIMPAEGEGQILVRMWMEGQYILCEIEDNGIGINQSLKQKQQSPEAHKSVALELAEKRLQLMGDGKDSEKEVIVEDLAAEGGRGTRVRLRIVCEES